MSQSSRLDFERITILDVLDVALPMPSGLLAVAIGTADHTQQDTLTLAQIRRQIVCKEEDALAGAASHVHGRDLELGHDFLSTNFKFAYLKMKLLRKWPRCLPKFDNMGEEVGKMFGSRHKAMKFRSLRLRIGNCLLTERIGTSAEGRYADGGGGHTIRRRRLHPERTRSASDRSRAADPALHRLYRYGKRPRPAKRAPRILYARGCLSRYRRRGAPRAPTTWKRSGSTPR